MILGNKFIDMKMQSNCKTKMAHLLLPNFEGDPMSIHHLWKYVESVVPSTFKDKDFFIMKYVCMAAVFHLLIMIA